MDGKIHAELWLFTWILTAASLLVACTYWHDPAGVKSIRNCGLPSVVLHGIAAKEEHRNRC